MAFMPNNRLVNPRLGSYFGIFCSLFAAIIILALVFEQLGLADYLVRALMLAAPILLYAAIALASSTDQPADFFAAGRRIPAFFSGLVMAVTALGGIGFMTLTGIILMIGIDGFALTIGWITGLIFMAVLLVPYLRKFGAYTVASYLGRRLDSRALRVISAAVLTIPALLLLVAEIRLGAFVSATLAGQSERIMAFFVAIIAAVIVAGGGMRSLTWSSTAKAIASLVALVIPVTIVAVLVSNLPLPQLSHGNLLRSIARMELDRGIPTLIGSPMIFDLPGYQLQALQKRFLQSFGHIGSLSFSLTILIIAAGIAGSPTLLARSGTTTGVYDARKAMGWSVFIAGFTILTLTAVAVFLRGLLVEQVVGGEGGQLPAWFQALQQIGIVAIDTKSQLITLNNIAFRRDAAIFALPIAAGLPHVITYLAMAGALAAALAATAAGILTLGTTLAEDAITGLRQTPPSGKSRIMLSRVAIIVVALVAAGLALLPADPLELAIWSITISAATSFPILVLSILWKRLSAPGAIAGLLTGLGVTVLVLLASEAGLIALQGPLAALLGMPAAALAAAAVSKITASPDRHVLELVRDMRVPGGETLHDREVRIARLKQTAQ
jgi:cation/acetate symporter